MAAEHAELIQPPVALPAPGMPASAAEDADDAYSHQSLPLSSSMSTTLCPWWSVLNKAVLESVSVGRHLRARGVAEVCGSTFRSGRVANFLTALASVRMEQTTTTS